MGKAKGKALGYAKGKPKSRSKRRSITWYTPAVEVASDEPTTFGKYLLCEQLAEGGMAVVWRAKIIGPGGFEKEFCLKQIRAELAARREFVDLFVAEAKLTVSLTHANIVPVYELGMVDGTYFLALELIDGPPLTKLIRGGALPPPVAAYIVEQILRGLEYAHRRGVVHRDLSPANVLVSRDGEVKIVDFGIAAPTDGTGVQGGSAGYMPPEQESGGRTDPRSDLFAVGVVLGELLSGKRATALTTEVPASLRDVVARATSPAADDRYPDAAAMLAALSRYLRDEPAGPTQSELSAFVRRRAPAHRRQPANGTGPRTVPAGKGTGPHTVPIGKGTGARRALDDTGNHVTFATRIALPERKKPTPLYLWAIAVGLVVGVAVAVGVYLGGRPPPPKPIVERPQPIPMPQPPPAAKGRLQIRSNPPGAEAHLGDRLLGLTPVDAEVPIAAGAIVLRRRGYDPLERPFEATAFVGTPPTATFNERLNPLARGSLTLNALPWAHVSIDGEKKPDTPLRLQLPVGVHQIRLVSPPTGRELRFSVVVDAGGEVKRVVDLRGEPHFID